jgi:transaldolase
MNLKNKLKSKIFLDSSDSTETKEITQLLGFLDGQTTNPSLIAKNPQLLKFIQANGKFEKQKLLDFYKKTIQNISLLIPDKSVSIEAYVDQNSQLNEVLKQAKIMQTWIKNCHIKLPVTRVGLEVASQITKDGGKVNMTLVFNQEQALAVHNATLGCQKGQVLISPFLGRLNDSGQNGMDLIQNIQKMYKEIDSNVEILAASIRDIHQLIKCLEIEIDILTCPFLVLKNWIENGKPSIGSKYNSKNLQKIEYKNLDFKKNWQDLDIYSELTEAGLKKFVEDWNSLIIQ